MPQSASRPRSLLTSTVSDLSQVAGGASPHSASASSSLGTGLPSSVLKIAAAIADGLGKRLEPEVLGQYRSGDIRHCYADTTLAEHLLGFRAQIPFARGMEDLLAWLEAQEARDDVDAAHEALVARGLAR